MPSKMYNLFSLFLLSNVQYIASEDNIDLYDMNIQQVEGTNHLEISFRVNGSIEDLNGHFSVVHKDCPAWSCGSETVGIKGEGQKVTIELLTLSPCKSYSGIVVNAFRPLTGGPLKVDTNWEASCSHLTTTSTPITTLKPPPPPLTTTTTSTTTANSTDKNNASDASSATYGIIVGAVLIIFVLTAIIVILFKKKKRNGKQKRGETVKIDANPVYGNYDNGPIYNVVTDGNDYYASSNNDYDHMGD